jgi:hypothetical protein
VSSICARTPFDKRIANLQEPQGLGYLPLKQALYVANGGDGSVRCFTGDPLRPCGTVKLDADADNVRLDSKTSALFVGHGNGAIAVLDANSWRQVRDIPLQGIRRAFRSHRQVIGSTSMFRRQNTWLLQIRSRA